MDAGGLRAFAGSFPPCASRNSSRIVDECQLAYKHKLLKVLVLRKSACRGASQSRNCKASIVVSNAAVADDVGAAATAVLGLWWLRFRDMGSIVLSSMLSLSSSMPLISPEGQGAVLQARAKTISHSDESAGTLDNVITKRWRHEDGGIPIETRTTSGRSASTSGRNGATRPKKTMDAGNIQSLEVLARRETTGVDAQDPVSCRQSRVDGLPTTDFKRCSSAMVTSEIRSSERLEEIGADSNGPSRLSSQEFGQSRASKSAKGGLVLQIRAEDGNGVSYRSQNGRSNEASTSTFIENLIDAAGMKMLDMNISTGATDYTTGQNGTVNAVDNYSTGSISESLAKGNRTLTDQDDIFENSGNVSAWDKGLVVKISASEETELASGIPYPGTISEAKENAMRSIYKQLSSLNGRNGGDSLAGNGGRMAVKTATVRRVPVKLPDNIEEVLPVDPKRDPAEYLFFYVKLLGAGRLQDCVAILESIDECALLNMDKVNPYEFYAACKKRRALKEAFKFSRLVRKKSLRHYNMLLSVCAQAQDATAACRVLDMVRKAGLQADCMFFTTLISACAKAGRIDLMFKFFNEMESEGLEANVQTFGAMIDGCARAGDVPKAFGIYKKMLNQNVKPDRVIFNTLIAACGRAGAVLRAFEVLSDMRDLPDPVALDHFTYGALIAACARAGEVERALEVYKRMRSSKVAGTAECYTSAVHACSQKGYLHFALSIYDDMIEDDVLPDEVFFCALIDVAGHAGKLDVAFSILRKMKSTGIEAGAATYNMLLVVCSKANDVESAMHVYEEIKGLSFRPMVSTLNALVASLCAGRQLDSALTVLEELRRDGLMPNKDTYSIMLEACEREDQASVGLILYNQSKDDLVKPTLKMCDSIIGLCVRRAESGAPPPQDPRLHNMKTIYDDVVLQQYWTCQGLVAYDDLSIAGLMPTLETLSKVLGCMRVSKRSSRHISSEGRSSSNSFRHRGNSTSLSVEEACGMYLSQALTIYEEARTFGVIQKLNYTAAAAPISVDMRTFPIHAGEVGVLALLKDLKQRHDVGLYFNSVTFIFAVQVKEAFTARGGFKRVQASSRTGQAVTTLLRKLRIKYQGHDSLGEVTITNSEIRVWFRVTQTASQKPSELQTMEPSSLSCGADSLLSIARSKQRLSHYSLQAIENATVV